MDSTIYFNFKNINCLCKKQYNHASVTKGLGYMQLFSFAESTLSYIDLHSSDKTHALLSSSCHNRWLFLFQNYS